MKSFREYWTFSAIRGALTLIVATGMFLVPYAASAIVEIPFMLALVVDVLAAYMLMDAGANFLLATQLPATAGHRKLLYAQAVTSVVFGGTYYLFTYGAISPQRLMLIVALQACMAAIFELEAARDTHRQYGCASCYSTAAVLLASAIGLPFASLLDAQDMTLVLVGYVGAYGGIQLTLAARMLFVEYRSEHPAPMMSMAWRTLMQPNEPVTVSALASCENCVAESVCRDGSLHGQLQQVGAMRQPAIVRSIRAASLLRPSGIYRSAIR